MCIAFHPTDAVQKRSNLRYSAVTVWRRAQLSRTKLTLLSWFSTARWTSEDEGVLFAEFLHDLVKFAQLLREFVEAIIPEVIRQNFCCTHGAERAWAQKSTLLVKQTAHVTDFVNSGYA